MDRPQAFSATFPKPGRALWTVLVTIAVLGISNAFLLFWVRGGEVVFAALACVLNRALQEPWRLLTSGLLTNPQSWTHLLFTLVGFYFLGGPLERRWGAWRFGRFLAMAVLFGNLATLAVNAGVPPDLRERFIPALVFGPGAAIAAIAVAWSREYPDSTVNLFFFLPMRGRLFLWITIGFCMLDLIYPASIPEGVIAPFGGVLAGLLFGGTPSLARRTWLHVRLAFLRRTTGGVSVQDLLSPDARRRSRAGRPPLRVVTGGVEEQLKNRPSPKDKRYLN
jgi:membrane associated rhomboid family serine protease